MAAKTPQIAVRFVGLGKGDEPPAAALYVTDKDGAPTEKLARVTDGRLEIDAGRLKGARIAIGPDVEDVKSIDPAMLLRYRGDQVLEDWLRRGIFIPADRWPLLLKEIICVSGRVRKCRPWWYDQVVVAAPRAKLGVQQRSLPFRIGDLSEANIYLPISCLPLCDGVVEVFERVCCCHHIIYDDLIDRLREVLERIPIEIDFPVPPEPDPGPLGPLGIERAAPFARPATRTVRSLGGLDRVKAATAGTTVSKRVFQDYQALLRMPRQDAEAYVLARPYLTAYICSCSARKVGEAFIQPGGTFDFCYWRPRHWHGHHHHCFTTFAYRVKQFIGGVWVTVYNGLAGHDYFAAGEEADLRTSHGQARPCGDGPEPPDPGEGLPFVMLEHVTGASTHHFNFPIQSNLSKVGALGANSGLYNFGGVPDCPWASRLGLRLWVTPSLEGTVVYYRFKVVAVDGNGTPVGTPTNLGGAVSWSRYVNVPGDVITVTTGLAANPADVGGEVDLFTVPYWTGGMNWLSGQYHQTWNTTNFPDGNYLLVLELFGPGGARIKPNGAPAGNPGTAKAFQFRRWEAPTDTANVPFADCAHVFRINNTPVVGDIFDLRKNHVPSTDECQFMSGPGSTPVSVGSLFSVGFRAYHVAGVTTGGGPGDTNSFMRSYAITWQRGLNGPTGTVETGTADQGELAVEESNALSFSYLLGPFPPTATHPDPYPAHTRCSFSVHLHVDAKHQDGGSFVDYDYHETASFALELT